MKMRALDPDELTQIRDLALEIVRVARAHGDAHGLDMEQAGNHAALAMAMVMSGIADIAELHLARDSRVDVVCHAFAHAVKTFNGRAAVRLH